MIVTQIRCDLCGRVGAEAPVKVHLLRRALGLDEKWRNVGKFDFCAKCWTEKQIEIIAMINARPSYPTEK